MAADVIGVWLKENDGKKACACGCGGVIRLKRRDYRRNIRFIQGHLGRAARRACDTPDQFWAKARGEAGAGACWPCGRMTQYQGVGRPSRRLAYELRHGPIPADMHVRVGDGCGEASCVNPAHMRLVSRSEISKVAAARARAEGTMATGEMMAHSKLSASKAASMRERHAAGEATADLAAEMGVSEETARKAIVGLTWRHVPAAR